MDKEHIPVTKQSLLGFYFAVSYTYRWKLLLLFLFPILWCSAETLAPYLIKIMIDDLASKEPATKSLWEVLSKPLLYYLALITLMEFSIRACNYLWISFMPSLKSQFREETLSRALKRPLTFFQGEQFGGLMAKYKNLANSFYQLFPIFLYGIFPVFISSLLTIGFLSAISSLFTFLFVMWFLGMNLVTFLFAKQSIQLSNDFAASENKVFGHVGDLFRNIVAIKTTAGKNEDERILKDLLIKEERGTKRLEWFIFKADTLRSVISALMLLLMVALLGWGWKGGVLTLGDFSFITAVCFYMRRSAWVASVNLLELFKGIGIAKEALFYLNEGINEGIKPRSALPFKGFHIKVDSLSFGYQANARLFQKISLEIPQGQRVLIAGPSGSGKTTFAKLLVNLLKPMEGSILISGEAIEQKSQKALTGKIFYIPQNATLFHRTVMDNITYGAGQATDDQVKKAAELARAHEFIMALEHKYQTIIGENGLRLSGGQGQRIALARAFLTQAPLLILDEATSDLDRKMEQEILNNIVFYSKAKTLIMVTHNLDNAALFDRILYFENGIIKQDTYNHRVA